MKKTSFLLLIITTSILFAQKPTNQQVVNMIKVGLKKDINRAESLMGLPYTSILAKGPEFKKVKINSVKLIKVGKAQRNYYEQGGDYINSFFYVKALVNGSAILKEDYCFGYTESSDYNRKDSTQCKHKKYLEGELPFRKVAQKFLITTDEYGDWYAVYKGIADKRDQIDEDENRIKIYRAQHPIVKEEKKDDFLQSLIDENKKRDASLDKVKIENKRSLSTMKNQLTKYEDIQAIDALKQKCIDEDWLCGYQISNFKEFYFNLVKLEKKHHIKLIKKKRESMGHDYMAQHERDMIQLNSFFKKHPNVKNRFYSRRIAPAYLGNFSSLIAVQETDESAYLVFLELSKGLMSINLD